MGANVEYNEAIQRLQELTGRSWEEIAEFEATLDRYGKLNAAEVNAWCDRLDYVQSTQGGVIRNKNGQVIFRTTEAVSSSSDPINSNVQTKTKVKSPLNVQPATGGKVSIKSGVRQTGKFVLGTVAPAVLAAGIGIDLGKTIDSTLYNLNPNFWDEHGMSSLNPETWASITSDDDSGLGSLFNLIFGIDENGNTQAYIDEDSYAYLAYWMKLQDVFKEGEYAPPESFSNGDTITDSKYVKMSAAEFVAGSGATIYDVQSLSVAEYIQQHGERLNSTGVVTAIPKSSGDQAYYAVDGAIGTGTLSNVNGDIANLSPSQPIQRDNYNFIAYTSGGVRYFSDNTNSRTINSVTKNPNNTSIQYILLGSFIGAPEGIGNQSDATLPDTSDWTDPDTTKQSLQQQYPGKWADAVDYDMTEDDGTQKTRKYIPVNLPDAYSSTDQRPTSGERSQSDPKVDPDTATDELLRTIIKIITEQGTASPTPTGSGGSPSVLPPTGSASSLWAVYNPTQAELDSFGAWLWSSNLVEQIKKLFADPMQAIIGVHKVFATPPTGGAQTIKCGYIDSGVSAAVVTGQYVTIDCGSVSLREYYENVLDYAPYTEARLYLPFIGIVPLDVADVMRGTVKVKYHVDVITGACLADVSVSRDDAGGVLYQYSGSAIVTYPVSSGSYVGAVAGVLSIAGGIAGTIATGGALAPALAGGALGATHLHSDVQHSGGFSGAPGAMGAKKPYIIISRPQNVTPDFSMIVGTPATRRVTLGSCDGYTKVDQMDLDGIPATSRELAEIETLLKQGVIL